jgi:hypothetical protein
MMFLRVGMTVNVDICCHCYVKDPPWSGGAQERMQTFKREMINQVYRYIVSLTSTTTIIPQTMPWTQNATSGSG